MKRKRGGQIGNKNAFRHGFYSDQFKQAERASLSQIEGMDLASEIEVMRVELRRYLKAESVASDQLDYETRLQALRTISLAADSLSRLVRTQVILNADLSKYDDDPEDAPTTEDGSD